MSPARREEISCCPSLHLKKGTMAQARVERRDGSSRGSGGKELTSGFAPCESDLKSFAVVFVEMSDLKKISDGEGIRLERCLQYGCVLNVCEER